MRVYWAEKRATIESSVVEGNRVNVVCLFSNLFSKQGGTERLIMFSCKLGRAISPTHAKDSNLHAEQTQTPNGADKQQAFISSD